MSKVLFFSIPLQGHTNPTLPLVKELVRRGEEVTYYSLEPLRSAIEQIGATFRSYGASYEARMPVKATTRPSVRLPERALTKSAAVT